MVYELKDKVMLITGAARGIGSHIVRVALDEGVKQIAILDIDESNGVALQDELNEKYGNDKVKFIKCDVTNEEQLISNFKAVLGDKNTEYIVINSAGIYNDSWRAYRKEIEINMTALITGSLIALDLMRKDKGGKGGAIINMSSIAALCNFTYLPVYNATKSAVMQFSVGIGHDDYYLRTGTRVLTMCFGLTDTEIFSTDNRGTFDEIMGQKLSEDLKTYPMQKVESASRAVMDAYKLGKSGSIWLSNVDKPAEDITKYHVQAYEILSKPTLQ